MSLRTIPLLVSVSILGVFGCTHNGGGTGASYAPPTTTLSDTGMTREQLEAQGNDKISKGSNLEARGIADKDDNETKQGQQMQEDGQNLLDEAHALAPSN
jgi:hypothetical protein